MTLDEYLRARKLTEAGFGLMIEVGQGQVHRYRSGQIVPRREIMARIVAATKGKVTANDFYNSSPRKGE